MAPRQARRSSQALLAGTVGTACSVLALKSCFLTAGKVDRSSALVAVAHGRTAMRGFKEDFESWRSSLTPEEQELVQKQAVGEFNKKFRKSDEFKKDLPEEKVKSFSKILGKFFDAEAADYKKEVEAKVPNYKRLLEKAGDKVLDFKMMNRVVEIDRDADRRYNFAVQKAKKAQREGLPPPVPGSPQLAMVHFSNDDAESREKLQELFGPDVEVPPIGTSMEAEFPRQLQEQLEYVHAYLQPLVDAVKAGTATVNGKKLEGELTDEVLDKAWRQVAEKLINEYGEALKEADAHVETLKAFYRSESADKYKTKADVLKALVAELARLNGKEAPPIDEEILAELEQVPAVREGEFRHPWGIADKLYKSEAIDPFGQKYLLGVFETQEEARKAFLEWNDGYMKAREEMQSEMQQWSKQENARLEADTSGADRIRKMLEEARR